MYPINLFATEKKHMLLVNNSNSFCTPFGDCFIIPILHQIQLTTFLNYYYFLFIKQI